MLVGPFKRTRNKKNKTRQKAHPYNICYVRHQSDTLRNCAILYPYGPECRLVVSYRDESWLNTTYGTLLMSLYDETAHNPSVTVFVVL